MAVYALNCSYLENQYRRLQQGNAYPTAANVYQTDQGDLIVANVVFEQRATFEKQSYYDAIIEMTEMLSRESLFQITWSDIQAFRHQHPEFAHREELVLPDELSLLAQACYEQKQRIAQPA